MKKIFTLVAAAFLAAGANAQTFSSVISNGNAEGTKLDNFVALEWTGEYGEDGTTPVMTGQGPARIVADEQAPRENPNNHCFEVVSSPAATNAWDAQFFVKAKEALPAGTKVQFSLKVRGSAEGKITTQAHADPGNYIHFVGVGDINVTTEWTEYTKEFEVSADQSKADKQFLSIAFNLNENKTQSIKFYFDDIKFRTSAAVNPEPLSQWVNLAVNGNCEGEDGSSLIGREAGVDGANFVDGAGVDGSRAIRITSSDNASRPWDTQFFITTVHKFINNEKYSISFAVRADDPATVSIQTHKAPGSYQGGFNPGSINVTTEWQTFTFDGVAASELQSWAFNLNEDKTLKTNFYFDNVYVLVNEAQLTDEEKAIAGDALPTAIKTVTAKADGVRYNAAGQRVGKDYKGLVIENGQKFLVK